MIGATFFVPAQWINASLVEINASQGMLSANVLGREQAMKYHRVMERDEDAKFNRRHSSRRLANSYEKKHQNLASKSGQRRPAIKQHVQLIPNQRYSLADTRNAFRDRYNSLKTDRAARVVSHIYTGWKQSLKKGKISLKRIQNTRTVFQTYENEEFTIQVPKNLDLRTREYGHFFENKRSDFRILVRNIESGCGEEAFTTACVANLSRDENRRDFKNLISYTTQLVRQKGTTDIIFNDHSAVPVMSESFVTHVLGDEIYVSRYFVEDPSSEGVYMIESRNDVRTTHEHMDEIRKIFESFRVYKKAE